MVALLVVAFFGVYVLYAYIDSRRGGGKKK
jgi:hypothetical protein